VTRFPIVTLSLSSIAAAIESWPGATLALQLDRAAFVWPQCWRIVTCQFTHFGMDHLLWDVLVFLILGMICERIDRRKKIQVIAISIIAIPMMVILCLPGIQTYRGLSGIDSALFGLLAAHLIRENVQAKRRIGVIFTISLVIAFLLKLLIEMLYGVTVFADSAAGGFIPVPLAHLVGLLIGLYHGVRTHAVAQAFSLCARVTSSVTRASRASRPCELLEHCRNS
jgi:rhomboid family GlyGly-CTERM serine protease